MFSSLSLLFLKLLFLRLNLKNMGKLSPAQKEVDKFVLPLTVTALSGTSLDIDIIMLGKFVGASYIAYYQIAFARKSGITYFF